VRIPRYTVLLLISLLISPIFFSNVSANDHGIINNELSSKKIIEDEELFTPNNPIALYYGWPNLVANDRVAYRSTSRGFEILNTSNPETIEVIDEYHLEENLSSGYLALNNTFLSFSCQL